ncbi:ribosomal protein L22e [Terfezia boudieri ATCC MYA-4762]|uniref:Ribosomal protein L22e n=1 Tax=Terfezia boudieri ATCC MYA-4762 TaxID=1051890 RepID=A0A3N4LN11_9PEZI|nr:ribosomal protein L22e [Terfezia boudieri ATCC MYA-4762]
MAPAAKSAAGKKQAKTTKTFTINASQPASDKIFDVAAFEKFLHDRIKVDNRVGNLGDSVQISKEGEGKVVVVAHIPFSGRYLKYLYDSITRGVTKKFLKKYQLRDWLRVVATSKGVYELKFFNVVNEGDDEDED